jgi:DNA-binding CsgD family transcriptional regulator
LWLEGVAGIGKTTLWRAGMELARASGWRVLACRPTSSETAFSFAALADLLGPVVDEVMPRLPPPQRAAIGAALALVEDEPVSSDERIVGLALLSALRLLAARGPILLAVDDVQWLDSASATALRFATRRLEDEEVKLLLSARIEAGAEPLEIERDLGERLFRIRVGSMPIGALHRIVVARFGQSLPRHVLARVHEASAGNPFYALEIAGGLHDQGVALGPGEPLPVPPTVEALPRARIMRLPEAVRDVLELAALLSEPTVEILEAAGADAQRLDRAVAAGVIEPIDDRIRFTHPLLASAVVSSMGPQRRRRLHARLGGLELDPEERARHLALASGGRDAATADSLEQAARHAALRGASASAAELAELAARRTPHEDREGRWRRMNEAGLRHGAAGDFARARALLEPLAKEIPAGPQRARVLLNLADIRWDDTREMIALAEGALAAIGDDDVSRARLHALLGTWTYGAALKLRHLRAALEAAERAGDRELTVLALVDLVHEEVALGQMTPGLLERAVALRDAAGARMLSRVPGFEHPAQALGATLTRLDRFDEARALLEAARADALEHGAYPAVAFTCVALSELACRLGDWRSAAAYASELEELLDQLGLEGTSPFSLHARARVDAHLGNVDEARAVAGRGIDISRAVGMWGYVALNQGVLGFVELSLGDVQAALRYLQPAVRRLDEDGWRDPSSDVRPNAIEVLVSAGELDEAARLLADLEDWSRMVGAAATAAVCLRCRGLLRVAGGDRDGALAAFHEALQSFERLPTPFEHGRTLLALGSLQRRARQKRPARGSLGAALATFEQLGARLWVEKARAELAQLGGRRFQDGRLTAAEHRIASLVARGHSNQQVADALFISPKTVEWNLSKIYKKLHVRSRTELAAKLAQRGHG